MVDGVLSRLHLGTKARNASSTSAMVKTNDAKRRGFMWVERDLVRDWAGIDRSFVDATIGMKARIAWREVVR